MRSAAAGCGRAGALCVAAALALATSSAGVAAASSPPDWTGEWSRTGSARFDPAKSAANQQIPFTPEARAYFDKIEADRALGGLADNFSTSCVPLGMPRVMIDYERFHIVTTPATTYVWDTESNELRRIYTDGRTWPEHIEPTYLGYSIGEWKDATGSGRLDTLEIETRGFRGPRTYVSSGAPLHRDNQSVVKERIAEDPAKTGQLRDEITTIDGALTRPWAVVHAYKRAPKVLWSEDICALDTAYLILGDEDYFIGAEGFLMPTKKNQKPPDLRYFAASSPASGGGQ